MPVSDFAKRMAQDEINAVDLIEGKLAMTISIARRLETLLGGSVEFWMSRDFYFHESVARLREPDAEWLAALPITDMLKFGWIKPRTPPETFTECLRFFDVSSTRLWHEKYSNVARLAAFRTSKTFDSSAGSVAAWLRQGERLAENIDCGPWNHQQFEQALSAIRLLTKQKDPKRFVPKLQQLCAMAGVALVIVRYPTGCRASGAARFISSRKALLQLSFRYLTDDQFWFTFYHEAAHLLLHGERGLFVDGIDENSSIEETEANESAASALIPSELRPALLSLQLTSKAIIRFAVSAGISPGIVVGQLQHEGRLKHNQLNSLKRRYEWTARDNDDD